MSAVTACSTQDDESAFETILFRILLLTDEVCTCVNILIIDVSEEQLVDDDCKMISRYKLL